MAPQLSGYFACAGFDSAGIANSGGAGRLTAEWILGGEAPGVLWDVDIRRFAPFMGNRRALAERTVETLGLHYAMRWPRQELASSGCATARRSTSAMRACVPRASAMSAALGWELYVPVEMVRHVERALREAGADLGLADAGYRALDALRIEAGRRAWAPSPGPKRRRSKPAWH